MHETSSPAELLASLPDSERNRLIQGQTEAQLNARLYDWRFWARPNQLRPGTPGAAVSRSDWSYWLLKAGRGFGKTRTGAETVREWIEAYDLIHLVGPTAADARDVMVQGPGGLLSCFPPHQRPVYEPSKRLVTFHTGAVAHLFSADEPERLRGPQCKKAWADELAAWRFLQDAWDNLCFGLRLGDSPQVVITTTPKPLKPLKDIIADPGTVLTGGSSYENRANLAPAFFEKIVRKYEGSRLGRQELLAELLEDTPGALWKQQWIDLCRVAKLPVDISLTRVVVGIDPAVSSGEESDYTGIVVVALAHTGHLYVLADLSMRDTPAAWAKTALLAYLHNKADRIVGEVNNGGDLVEQNLRGYVASLGQNAQMLPFRKVHASRGKAIRAEPVAALYEQGLVHHIGSFPELEEEMTTWVPGAGMKSPDRMDALVWAITDMVVQPRDQGVIVVDHAYQISPI